MGGSKKSNMTKIKIKISSKPVTSILLDADFRGLASRQLSTFPHIGAYAWVWQNPIEIVNKNVFVIKSTDRNYDDVRVDLRKLNERQKQHLCNL